MPPQWTALLAVAVGVVLAAQDPPKAGRLLSRRYIDGDRIQYVMKTQNDGSSYEVRITATTRKETDGRFVEDFAWSEMVANGAPRPLAATSQAFRLTVTLEGGAPFDMPDLSKAPGLIGPVTDLMTFYADLFLAMHQGALQKAGDRFCFSNPTASSWAMAGSLSSAKTTSTSRSHWPGRRHTKQLRPGAEDDEWVRRPGWQRNIRCQTGHRSFRWKDSVGIDGEPCYEGDS